MYMNSQHFSKAFTTVYEPYTPKFVMNALTLSGASGGGQLPSGWYVSAGAVPFFNDGVQKYIRFASTGTTNTISLPFGSKVTQGGTNGGVSHVIVARMNRTSTTNVANTYFFGAAQSGICPFRNNSTFTFNSPYTGISAAPSTAITFGRNKFMVFTLVWVGTTQNYYLDGVLIGTNPNGAGSAQTDLTSASTALVNLNSTPFVCSFDVMYHAFYDRPLTSTQAKDIFNSFAPVLEIGTVAPVYTPTTSFSSVVVPTSPLFSWNAYDYTQTNGQSYAPGATGWTQNNVANLYWGVDGINRRFINFNTNNSWLQKTHTVNALMNSNGGYSFAMMMRVNNYTNGGQNALFSVGLADFYMNLQWTTGTLTQADNFNYLCSFSPLGGQWAGDTVLVPNGTFSNGKFMLVCFVLSGTTGKLFVNNVQMSLRFGVTAINGSGNQTGYTTSTLLGIKHANSVNPSDSIDISYAGFWDRPITTTEMTNLYNSVSMLLD